MHTVRIDGILNASTSTDLDETKSDTPSLFETRQLGILQKGCTEKLSNAVVQTRACPKYVPGMISPCVTTPYLYVYEVSISFVRTYRYPSVVDRNDMYNTHGNIFIPAI